MIQKDNKYAVPRKNTQKQLDITVAEPAVATDLSVSVHYERIFFVV